MTDNRNQGEDFFDYFERVAPMIYNAIDRIRGVRSTMKKLFGDGTTYWDIDIKCDITNKVMLGCHQMEIEKINNKFDKLEKELHLCYQRKKEWHFFGFERNDIVFENGIRDLMHIPRKLLYIIVNHKSFDGSISSDGEYAVYTSDKEIRIPKSLVNQLTYDSVKEMEDLESKVITDVVQTDQ